MSWCELLKIEGMIVIFMIICVLVIAICGTIKSKYVPKKRLRILTPEEEVKKVRELVGAKSQKERRQIIDRYMWEYYYTNEKEDEKNDNN